MQDEIEFLKKILFVNDENVNLTIFDIGANIGEYSMELINLGDSRIKEIHSFEPLPDFYLKLVNNTNSIKKIKAHNFAIDDIDIKKDMYQLCSPNDNGANGMSSFYWRDVFNKYPYLPNVSVKCIKLDNFIQENNFDIIDLIKIDTEGHELNVLKSLSNTLKNQKVKYIQFEYGGCFIDSKITMNDIIQFVKQFNYIVFKIENSNIKIINDFVDDYQHQNYFIMKDNNII